MSETPAVSQERAGSRRTISPFVLPTTGQSFLILILAAVSFLFQITWMKSATAERHFDRYAEDVFRLATQAEPDYVSLARNSKALVSDLLLALLFVSIVVISRYYFQPLTLRPLSYLKSKLRRAREETSDPKLDEEFHRLSKEVQVSSPKLELGDDWKLQSARTFGLPPFVIRLEAGFRVLYRKNPDAARVILLHELAHIRNGDVRQGWIADAVVKSAIVFAMILFINNVFGLNSFFERASLGGDAYVLGFGTVALLFFFYSRFLRAREVYADCRVHIWGAGEALRTLLAAEARAGSEPRRHLFSFHPTAAVRLRHLLNPKLLSDVSRLDMFGLGVLVGIAIPPATTLLSSAVLFAAELNPQGIGRGRGALLIIPILLIDLALSYALMATLGTAIQRDVIYAIADKDRKRTVWRDVKIALCLSIGAYVGAQLPTMAVGTIHPVAVCEWVITNTVLLLSVTTYVAFAFKRACKWVVSEKVFRNRARLVRLLGTVLLAALFPFLFSLATITAALSFGDEQQIKVFLAAILGLASFGLVTCSVWLLTAILVLLVWGKDSSQCPSCNAQRPPYAFETACTFCNDEVTPWLRIESLGPIEAPPKTVAPEPRAFSELEIEIMTDFAGKNLTAFDLCETLKRRYSERQCHDALESLEQMRAITVDPELKYRDSHTIPNDAMIYFPRQRSMRRAGGKQAPRASSIGHSRVNGRTDEPPQIGEGEKA